MENPGKALSREEILDAVWGKDYDGELKIVDVNIRRLRNKVELIDFTWDDIGSFSALSRYLEEDKNNKISDKKKAWYVWIHRAFCWTY